MINNKKLFILAFLLFIFLSFVFCNEDNKNFSEIKPSKYPITIQKLRKKISETMNKSKIPSISIAIIENQEVIWNGNFGYSNVEDRSLLTKADTFEAGSLSELFIDIAIMRLYENGFVDIDEPITNYINNFSIKTRFSETKPMTIRNIMSHRAGLPRDYVIASSLIGLPSKSKSLTEMIESLNDNYTAYPVEYRFKESKIGINLLARIIENVSGISYDKYIKENVFEPLGMSNTSMLFDSTSPRKLVKGYEVRDKKLIPIKQFGSEYLLSDKVYTTTEDLSKVIVAFLSDGNDLLERKTMDNMLIDNYSSSIDPPKIGAGWHISNISENINIVSMKGDARGYSYYIGFSPDYKIGIVLLANSSSFNMSRETIANEVFNLIIKEKTGNSLDEKQKLDENFTPAKLSKNILDKYVGKYTFGGLTGKISVTNNGYLKLTAENTNIGLPIEIDLLPINDTKFKPTHWIMNLIPESDNINLKAEFFSKSTNINLNEDIIVVNANDSFYFTLLKLPNNQLIPDFCNNFIGKYIIETENEVKIVEVELKIVENLLTLELKKILYEELANAIPKSMPIPTISIILEPVNKNEIIIKGGIFGFYDGETIFYNEDTRYLHFLDLTFKPKA